MSPTSTDPPEFNISETGREANLGVPDPGQVAAGARACSAARPAQVAESARNWSEDAMSRPNRARPPAGPSTSAQPRYKARPAAAPASARTAARVSRRPESHPSNPDRQVTPHDSHRQPQAASVGRTGQIGNRDHVPARQHRPLPGEDHAVPHALEGATLIRNLRPALENMARVLNSPAIRDQLPRGCVPPGGRCDTESASRPRCSRTRSPQ
jgi:hypothetical protein